MKTAYDVILRPVLTEQSYDNMADRKYTFIVAPNANKTEIKKAIETNFSVKIDKITTQVRVGKLKRQGKTQGYTAKTKRATVKLSTDSKGIEFFEGMAQ